MHQYHSTLDVIKRLGTHKGDRTGTGTQSHFGMQRRFSLRNNQLPVVTTKKIHLPSVIHELIWMLSGDTRVDYLIENGVRIWNEWVKPETAVYRDLTPEECRDAVNKFIGGKYYVNFHTDVARPGAVIHHVNDYQEATGDQPPILTDGVELILEVNTHCYGKHREAVAGLDMDDQFMSILHRLLIGQPRKLIGGDLGPVYGKTWRDIEDTRVIPKYDWSDYETRGFEFVTDIPGTSLETDRCVVTRRIDQIQDIIEQLKTNPDSRRIIVCAWNPALVDEQALPPCHTLFQFWTRKLSVDERFDYHEKERKDAEWEAVTREQPYPHAVKLLRIPDASDEENHKALDSIGVPSRTISCHLYCRSQDIFLGTPFNITFYSLMTHMLANQLNMVADEFIWSGGDCHIYSNHQEQVVLQMGREPKKVPTLRFKPEAVGKDIRDIRQDDFVIENYEYHPHIAGKVAV